MDQNPSSSPSSIFQDSGELKKVFDQFDTNNDGKISAGELRNVLESTGSSYTTQELQGVMDDVDTDKDGFINVQEFSRLCNSASDSETAKSELKDAFDLYDQDKDGLISAGELHLVLNQLGMKYCIDDCVRMIKNVDSDGDGCVSFTEFQKMMDANVKITSAK